MSLQISKIKIGERFRKELGDIQKLAGSITDLDLLHPVVVNEKNELISGQRRIEACKLLGWKEIPINLIKISELQKGEIHENRMRKNFTARESIQITRYLLPELQKEHPRGRPNKSAKLADKGEETRDIIAEYVGVSHGTLNKWEELVEAEERGDKKATEVLDEIEENTTTDRKYKKWRKEERENKRPELPTGLYEIILADPAWEFRDKGADGNADSQYETMPLEEIKQLVSKMNISKDSACFLWVPTVLIQEGLDVLKSWGFKYHNLMVWDKQFGGLGSWFKNEVEILLFGTKGDIKTPVERVSNIIREKKTKH